MSRLQQEYQQTSGWHHGGSTFNRNYSLSHPPMGTKVLFFLCQYIQGQVFSRNKKKLSVTIENTLCAIIFDKLPVYGRFSSSETPLVRFPSCWTLVPPTISCNQLICWKQPNVTFKLEHKTDQLDIYIKNKDIDNQLDELTNMRPSMSW